MTDPLPAASNSEHVAATTTARLHCAPTGKSSPTLKVTVVAFSSATSDQVLGGLLGYLELVVNDALQISATLRRTLNGRITISFPTRRNLRGRQHPLVKPLNDTVRRAIEAQVLDALGRKQDDKVDQP